LVREKDAATRARVRSQALTELREQMAQEWQALVCLGGKSAEPPGVEEEVRLTRRRADGIPLYLLGYLGGYTLTFWRSNPGPLHNGLEDEQNEMLNTPGPPHKRISDWRAVDLVMKGLLSVAADRGR
jgi:SLOG cluster2